MKSSRGPERKQYLTCGLPLEHGGHCERPDGHEGPCDRWITIPRLDYDQSKR